MAVNSPSEGQFIGGSRANSRDTLTPLSAEIAGAQRWDKLIAHIVRFKKVVDLKRQHIGKIAHKRTKRRYYWSVSSGFLSLLSVGALASLFAKWLPEIYSQVSVAVTALSALASFALSTFYDEKETAQYYAAMSIMLSLRERANEQMFRTVDDEHQVYKEYCAIRTEYADISRFIDPLILDWFEDDGPAAEIRPRKSQKAEGRATSQQDGLISGDQSARSLVAHSPRVVHAEDETKSSSSERR